jgi:hypothetical protein
VILRKRYEVVLEFEDGRPSDASNARPAGVNADYWFGYWSARKVTAAFGSHASTGTGESMMRGTAAGQQPDCREEEDDDEA